LRTVIINLFFWIFEHSQSKIGPMNSIHMYISAANKNHQFNKSIREHRLPD